MITVLMAINKYDAYCPKAINSILDQTLKDIELLIIANGPDAEKIKELVLAVSKNDVRVKVITSQIGQLANALNIGIDNASFDFIARMDADDISHASRLEKQIDYLEINELDMVGCNARLIDENDKFIEVRKMINGSSIGKAIPFKNTFIHPSILIKKSILLKVRGYNSGFNSEDYDLWLRLWRMGIKWNNMDDVLLDYRIHRSASQRKLLGYAESLGYAVREFMLKKNSINLLAIFYHFGKALFRAKSE
ncbi:MAG: glycosyltransferase [Cellvibrionaceae bacterium]